MYLEAILVSAGITILTNLSIELGKYISRKSKCKIKMEIGDNDKSSGELVKLKK